MTYRFPELGNKIATAIALVLVFIAMEGRWTVGIPARADPVGAPSLAARRRTLPPQASTGPTTPSSSSSADPPIPPRSASPGPRDSPATGDAVARVDLGDRAACSARGSKGALTGTLDLNSATIEQLTLLPGIGPTKAERIVAWRRAHGPFRRTADIRRVSGFGFKTFKRLEPYLAIKGPTTLTGG